MSVELCQFTPAEGDKHLHRCVVSLLYVVGVLAAAGAGWLPCHEPPQLSSCWGCTRESFDTTAAGTHSFPSLGGEWQKSVKERCHHLGLLCQVKDQ